MDMQTNPETPKQKNKTFTFVLVLLLALSLFYFREQVGDIFTYSRKASTDLREFAKDISMPGALVSKLESQNAYLTVVGIFEFTNVERKKGGLATLAFDKSLSTIAQKRLDDMFLNQYFEHVSPTGSSAGSLAEDIGYEYIAIGENIALGNFENDAVLVQAWMDSPGHRANIVSTKYSLLGIAVGKGVYQGRTTWIGVQIFGKPLSACPSVSATLKEEIAAMRSNSERLTVEITIIEKKIVQAKKDKDYDTYNNLVAGYNSLAKELNLISSKLKDMIQTYNREVNIFNSCAGVSYVKKDQLALQRGSSFN